MIDIKKAYEYYINNIGKSENKTILPYEQFERYFTRWIQEHAQMAAMSPELMDIPELNKQGKSRIVNIKTILAKCV